MASIVGDQLIGAHSIGQRPARGRLVTRRSVLHVGTLGLAGMSLAQTLGSRRACATSGKPAKARSMILIWQGGGPSQLDTWDLKPAAAAEIRGEFRPIASRVPGIEVCELLPESAARMDQFAIVRSLTHLDAGHDSATHYLLTGHAPISELPGNEMPSLGSVIAREFAARRGELPPYVALPQAPRSSAAAYLGEAYNPFSIGADLSASSFSAAQPLVAKNLSRVAQRAFALEREDARLRDRYGRGKLGQSLLLARRLVEAGVTFVTVDAGGWDTHAQQFPALRDRLPEFDRAWSALLADMAARGMLDETLVLVWGEFGRAPHINASAGRDHWPGAMSALLAGGGLATGQTIGRTDASGACPDRRPVAPEDVLVTIYHALGIDPQREYANEAGQRVKILARGTPIQELVG